MALFSKRPICITATSNRASARRSNGQFQRRAQALCIATSTLELGIDIGDVDAVVLYEPPESVTTFVQRLGRANRHTRLHVFWGICRGPRAGEQLLQFLALCRLAQQGVVEMVRPSHLPSVLVQQVLSCLYAHKTLSIATLQALFPHQAELLARLLPVLEERHWLRRAGKSADQELGVEAGAMPRPCSRVKSGVISPIRKRSTHWRWMERP